MNYSKQEMMAVATGREICDGDLCIFGVGLSMLAGYFAIAHHAPNARAIRYLRIDTRRRFALGN